MSIERTIDRRGSGSMQTLCPQGFAQTTLAPKVVVWFIPGVVRRLVNDGGLEILAIMSLAGLAETGDAVLTFPADILGDPGATGRRPRCPSREIPVVAACPDAVMAAAVRARRDLAVEGFAQLRPRVEGRGPAVCMTSGRGRYPVRRQTPRWQEFCASGVLEQGA